MEAPSLDAFYQAKIQNKAQSPVLGMAFEFIRLASFINWPSTSPIRPTELARAGFYRLLESGEMLVVACFSCAIEISDWLPSDVPLERHRRASPNCAFLNPGQREGPDSNVNIPLWTEDRLGSLTLTEAFNRLKPVDPHAQRSQNGSTENETSGSETERNSEDQNDSAHSSQDRNVGSPAPLTHQYQQNTSSVQQKTSSQRGSFRSDGVECSDPVRAAIDRVPHKPCQPNPQTNNTDPRKRADMYFMDSMRSEKERRKTFYDWPEGAWQTPTALAAAGFFYTGTADRCQCAFCRGCLRNWEPNDSPMDEHGRHFGECPFVNGRNVGNVPDRSSHQRDGATRNRSSAARDVSALGIVTQKPRNPEFAQRAKRIESYNHPAWTFGREHLPTKFADAGFYYTGSADQVKCFFCEGALNNWGPQDDPWVQHANYYPGCGFLKSSKGDSFVQEIQRLQAAPIKKAVSSTRTSSAAGTTANSVVYRIESKEVKARMDTALVRSVIQKGHAPDIVRKVIGERLQTTGDDFQRADELLEAIFEMEERLNHERRQQEPVVAITPPLATPLHGAVRPTEEQWASMAAAASAAPTPSPLEENPSLSKSKKKRAKRRAKSKTGNQDAAGQTESLGASANTGAASADTGAAKSTAEQQLAHVNPEYQDLIQQNEEMKEQRVCKVCLDNEINQVFLPCAHLVCCASCSPALKTCPICRKVIKGTVRIFLS